MVRCLVKSDDNKRNIDEDTDTRAKNQKTTKLDILSQQTTEECLYELIDNLTVDLDTEVTLTKRDLMALIQMVTKDCGKKGIGCQIGEGNQKRHGDQTVGSIQKYIAVAKQEKVTKKDMAAKQQAAAKAEDAAKAYTTTKTDTATKKEAVARAEEAVEDNDKSSDHRYVLLLQDDSARSCFYWASDGRRYGVCCIA